MDSLLLLAVTPFLLDQALAGQPLVNEDEDEEYGGVLAQPPPSLVESSASPPPDGHISGGLPMISDSAFSLVILLYVSIAFCFVFFMFCWKTDSSSGPDGSGQGGLKGTNGQCILMTNNWDVLGPKAPIIIPPTPPPPLRMECLVDEQEHLTSAV